MKSCIILAPKTALGANEVFPLLKEGVLHPGFTQPKQFVMPDGSETKNMSGATLWLTNEEYPSGKPLALTKSYYDNPAAYPRYDNYDAIEVGRIRDIPYDYDGPMGVPITFLMSSHPEFEILGQLKGEFSTIGGNILGHQAKLNGKSLFTRIIIQRKAMNQHLLRTRKVSNDLLYTRESDLIAELVHHNLRGKWVYSPCSDHVTSIVPKYFTEHFHELGLSHYTATCIDNGNGAYRYDYDGKNVTITKLQGNGSFDSPECTAILKGCDIVIENPPFSLLPQFIEWLKAA